MQHLSLCKPGTNIERLEGWVYAGIDLERSEHVSRATRASDQAVSENRARVLKCWSVK